ncbi:hypothetical protein SDC9_130954 [bioreactor metagenome]|uniref:Uncharacterized protein n=1 Tax=bioreactor metagenome TaxID=1076179 RepID=A0A645D3W7_9ZZZZ
MNNFQKIVICFKKFGRSLVICFKPRYKSIFFKEYTGVSKNYQVIAAWILAPFFMLNDKSAWESNKKGAGHVTGSFLFSKLY